MAGSCISAKPVTWGDPAEVAGDSTFAERGANTGHCRFWVLAGTDRSAQGSGFPQTEQH